MKIEGSNSVNFKARCPEIKAGQDVCHILRTTYPNYSISKLNKRIDVMHTKNYLVGEQYKKFIRWWNCKREKKFDIMCDTLLHSDYKLYEDTIKLVKQFKVADCGQAADLSAFILKLNGYNATTANLKIKNSGLDIDHAVCVFNKSNKPFEKVTKDTIILDSWLGECDFATNILKKYKEQYNGYFKIHGLSGPEEPFITIKPDEQITTKIWYKGIEINSKHTKQLREKYPELIIKNSKYKEPEKVTRRFFGLF